LFESDCWNATLKSILFCWDDILGCRKIESVALLYAEFLYDVNAELELGGLKMEPSRSAWMSWKPESKEIPLLWKSAALVWCCSWC